MLRQSVDHKKLAGTYKPSRESPVRPLAELEPELAFTRETLDDMRFNLSISNEAIRKYGMQMVFTSKDKNGHLHDITKMNPALRIQHEAIRNIKSLTVAIAFLEEQVERASKQKVDDDAWEEFAV